MYPLHSDIARPGGGGQVKVPTPGRRPCGCIITLFLVISKRGFKQKFIPKYT